jgi:hypothetical protein
LGRAQARVKIGWRGPTARRISAMHDGRAASFLFPTEDPGAIRAIRGNCSGHVYRIFESLHPRVFTDPMVGGGTSVEVAREMGIEAHGFDLHSGFNILKQRILDVVGKPSDLVLSHPPYPTSSCTAGRSGAGQGTRTICRAVRARMNSSRSSQSH